MTRHLLTTHDGRPVYRDEVGAGIRAVQQTTLARCYVALAEIDYDLRAWAEDTYVRNVIEDCGRLSDFEEHTAQGLGMLDRALGRGAA